MGGEGLQRRCVGGMLPGVLRGTWKLMLRAVLSLGSRGSRIIIRGHAALSGSSLRDTSLFCGGGAWGRKLSIGNIFNWEQFFKRNDSDATLLKDDDDMPVPQYFLLNTLPKIILVSLEIVSRG